MNTKFTIFSMLLLIRLHPVLAFVPIFLATVLQVHNLVKVINNEYNGSLKKFIKSIKLKK